ncbi:dicarboxylate/amino acid:cation symporter [Hydrogenothermus marinus]|uniref:Na+/H+-dicarboxylate symporter n=1 Tax=Hydrogenothermus marinus TaxID=133270 RepID=A0A3M0BMZ3_9AQUI|nr:dicarboxylate/amino acid:cation symporter [Hydrogenothermus marinus]RMA92482.1 Na+/H+-dicarboxylate symporter [Hydrogenothermus marinus]
MKKFLSIENLTILGIILGILVGIYIPELALNLKILGDIFLNLLKMIVIPLIFVSIFVSISTLSSANDFKDLGIKAFLYYLATTTIAVITGLLVANIFPFSISDINLSSNSVDIKKLTFESFINNLIPSNIFESFAEGKSIHVIIFSILLAIAVLYIKQEKKQLIVNLFDGLNDAFLLIAKWIIYLSPIGVFALISSIVAEKGIKVIIDLWQYVLIVLIGIIWHFAVNLGLIAYLVGKVNPVEYFNKVKEAILVAFSTCSSSATLPVSLEVAEKEAKIPKKVAGFVLPLGATINMDGTALYEAVAALFIAHVFGIELSLLQQIIVVITSTLASIGAAAIPSAGLITMTLVFSSVGLPLEGIALIVAVDRFLDMFRTSTNVWGDLIGAKVISRFIK